MVVVVRLIICTMEPGKVPSGKSTGQKARGKDGTDDEEEEEEENALLLL